MTPDNINKADTELSGEKIVFYGFPALTGLAGGVFACVTAGFNSATLLGTALLTIAGVVAGRCLYQRQRQHLQQRFEQLAAKQAYSDALERLFLQAAPVLLQQLQTSRRDMEQEIAALTGQFAALALQLEDFAAAITHRASADSGSDKNDAGKLRANSERLHNEVCTILVAFQFQDRVSQMLTHVESNLACLSETVQAARKQGDKRDAGMIDIAQTLHRLKLDYALSEQHRHHPSDAPADNKQAGGDELTFF